jgi:methyl-accepting chemotaxis protein
MIEGSIKNVDNGTKIATNTAEALNRIVEDIAKVANIVENIAVASNEQASAISQINQGTMQVSNVVQTNSATAEESAAASEELSSQAELLREQVARFKLRRVKKGSYGDFDELSPELVKILDSMKNKNNYEDIMQDNSHKKSPIIGKSKRIVLSDKEFGKY